jgi:hypothetical protein
MSVSLVIANDDDDNVSDLLSHNKNNWNYIKGFSRPTIRRLCGV